MELKTQITRLENELYAAQIILDDIEFFVYPKHQELLADNMGYFNRHVFLLQDWLTLKVIRLFDPAKQGTNKNFCCESLCIDAKEKEYWDMQKKSIESSLEVLTTHRRKYLAHYDFHTIKLPSFREIHEAVKNLIEVIYNVRDKVLEQVEPDTTRSRSISRVSSQKIDDLLFKAKFYKILNASEISEELRNELFSMENSFIQSLK